MNQRRKTVTTVALASLLSLAAITATAVLSPLHTTPPVYAAEADDGDVEHAHAGLISDCDTIAAGKKFRLGVELKMDPGWHTYYRESGEAGMPTRITWELPPGFKASPNLLWEMPHKMVDAGIVTYGYNNHTVISSEITPPANLKPGDKLNFKAKVKWLVCKDACIPGGAEVELNLPVAASAAESKATNEDKFKPVNFDGPISAIKPEAANASSEGKKKSRRH